MMRLLLIRAAAGSGNVRSLMFGREGVTAPIEANAADDDNQLLEVRPTCEQARDYCLGALKRDCAGVSKTAGGMWSVKRRDRESAQAFALRKPDDLDVDQAIHKGRGRIRAILRGQNSMGTMVEAQRKADKHRRLPQIDCRQSHSKLVAWIRASSQSTKLLFRRYAAWLLLLLLLGDMARQCAAGKSVAVQGALIAVVGLGLAASSVKMDGRPWWEQRWMQGPKF